MQQVNQQCQSSQLWKLIHKLKIARKNPNLVVTTEQQYQLCNYMNGKPYDRQIIKEFIK
jgi:hypothetical protein